MPHPTDVPPAGRRPRACVIGGGIAGLTAAFELCKAGLPATVYEAASDLGGLAASIPIGDSFADQYYHFICGGDRDVLDLCRELGVSVSWKPTRMSYLVDGVLHPFSTAWDIAIFNPLSVRERLRLAAFSLRCRWLRDWRSIEDRSARSWLIEQLGAHTYQVVWNALLSTKFRQWHDQISAPWLWHRIWRASQSRRHALARERLGYTDGGTRSIVDALARAIRDLGGSVHTGREVTRLAVDDGGVRGLEIGGSHADADVVISTVPLPRLAGLLPDESVRYREKLLQIRFIGVVCVMLCLRRPITDSFWINVHAPDAPFSGFIEYGNLDDTSPVGTHLVYLPLYVDSATEQYRAGDDEVAAECMEALGTLPLGFHRDDVEECHVFRHPHAQAICPPGFSRRAPAISSPVSGLYITDSTQLYPEDRNRSGMIRLARMAAQLAMRSAS